VIPELNRLIALSPPALADVNAAARQLCAQTVRLAPLPYEDVGPGDPAVTDFIEQFSADVSAVTGEQRAGFLKALGPKAFDATALIFVADFAPRVGAAFDSLGIDWSPEVSDWDRVSSPADVVLNGFAPAVARMHTLDPVTSEIVRLRGARQHNCRLCNSLRDGDALDAGGTEDMYQGIDVYDTADLSDRHKAALRYVDALIWTPAAVVGADLLRQFTRDEAVELTLDVMRNACNKIAVALAADAPRVEEGTERYHVGTDGRPVYS